MMRPTLSLLVLCTVLVLGACDADNKYSRKFPCSFVFQTQYHTTSLLTRALGNTGTFVIVEVSQRQGINHVTVTSYDSSQQEDIAMTTAIENDRTNYQYVGANQSLIIGLSNFDGLKAYDRQCPNCIENFSGTNYPLTFADHGIVNCHKCGRSYNLNAEGMPVNGKQGDKALMQYAVSYDGSRLYVHN